MTIFETLVTAAIIGIIAAMLLMTVSKSYINAKAWIWGAYSLQENRLEAVLNDDDKATEVLLKEKVHKWTFIK